jgi:hypothetical protein
VEIITFVDIDADSRVIFVVALLAVTSVVSISVAADFIISAVVEMFRTLVFVDTITFLRIEY